MSTHTFPGVEFWTPERIAASQAMRRYRRSWAACSQWEQWQLRVWVHALRGAGIPESEIAQHVHGRLCLMRPWRLSDGELVRALKARRRSTWRR